MLLPIMLRETLRLIDVILIDITLAGSNIIVIALAARGLATKRQKRWAILCGISFATFLRLGLTLIASHLLTIIGLTLLGGCLLLWVCWKILRDLLACSQYDRPESSSHFGEALLKIIIADVAMSFDNILAVAGASTQHTWTLLIGVCLSVIIIIVSSTVAMRLLKRFIWLNWLGLAALFFVSIKLLLHGGRDLWPYLFS